MMPELSEPELPLPYRRDPACPFDPDKEFSRLRADEPISRISLNGGDQTWLITRFADAKEILADLRFSSELTPMGIVLPDPENRTLAEELKDRQPGTFIEYDPPEHTRLRRMIAGEFSETRMRALRPRVEEIVEERLDAMAAAGSPVDLVEVFALPVPTTITCELLGLEPEYTFDFAGLTAIMTDVMAPIETLIPARDEMRAHMRALVERIRRNPTADNMIGRLILANGDGVSDDELTGIALLFLVAGHETTAMMLGIGTLALLHNPDQLALLRADPSIVEDAADELVRYISIPNHGEVRTALEDIEYNGVTFKQGDQVLISLPSANRDEDRWTDPDRLDFTRKPKTHLAYGHGIHYCIGKSLAKLEMHVAYPALLRRFPGLRLAVPFEEVPFRWSNVTHGVHALPVAW
jgi:cytochrome P450